MEVFEYYASLRTAILGVITGVQDSDESLFWDNTTPNYITKIKLEKLYERYLMNARIFGLYVVTRHSDCPNPKHSGYPVSNAYGLPITYRDEGYVWNGGQMYQGTRNCVCPCSPMNKQSDHYVIDDVIFDKAADHELCKKLAEILDDVMEAINCAEDNKPRSAIRENLLRALLQINDELLPEPMNLYIEKKLKAHT